MLKPRQSADVRPSPLMWSFFPTLVVALGFAPVLIAPE